jgi:hypothetical protein
MILSCCLEDWYEIRTVIGFNASAVRSEIWNARNWLLKPVLLDAASDGDGERMLAFALAVKSACLKMKAPLGGGFIAAR